MESILFAGCLVFLIYVCYEAIKEDEKNATN